MSGMVRRKGIRRFSLTVLGICILVSGCTQQTVKPEYDANMTPRDRELLAFTPYGIVKIPEQYQRQIVDYHRKESPGTILIDTDNRYLYYVLPNGKAIRYGVIVGKEGLAWSGIAKIGRMTEWPTWRPTADMKKRLGKLPDFVGPGPDNPMGARAMYLFEGNKDTLYRIHGTNEPELIGKAMSSGCISLTNEDVIDLYKRVKLGTVVVVLGPHQGDALMALGGGPHVN
jgi:lipoprotein-anchoring transpeptidase ErfK/SrfK